jgi:hypothetical protein
MTKIPLCKKTQGVIPPGTLYATKMFMNGLNATLTTYVKYSHVKHTFELTGWCKLHRSHVKYSHKELVYLLVLQEECVGNWEWVVLSWDPQQDVKKCHQSPAKRSLLFFFTFFVLLPCQHVAKCHGHSIPSKRIMYSYSDGHKINITTTLNYCKTGQTVFGSSDGGN